MNIQHLFKNSDLVLTLLLDEPALEASVLESRLSAREAAFGRTKKSPAVHRAWLLGRWAAKAAAAEFWSVAAEDAEVSPGPEGAPVLSLKGRAEVRACLSISHCPGAALAAVSERPLGVDLERRDRGLSERVCRWAFNDHELGLLSNGRGGHFPEPLALWCAREAAAKSWGRALLDHLDQVRVARADWGAGLLWVDWLAEPSRQSRVELLNHGEYLLALAR